MSGKGREVGGPRYPVEVVAALSYEPAGWRFPVGGRLQSHGGGQQSCAMYLHLREIGNLPDAVVACDTRHEHPETYRAWRTQRDLCREDGVPFVVLRRPISIIDKFLADGRLPLPHRQRPSCSTWAKRDAVREWLTRDQGVNERRPAQAYALIGYSVDKVGRKKDSDRKWVLNEFPLLDARMSREDCVRLLERAWPGPLPPKSGCVWCPHMGVNGLAETYRRFPVTFAAVERMEDSAKPGSGTLFQGLRVRHIREHVERGLRPPKERNRPVDDGSQTSLDNACAGIAGCWT